MTQEIYSSSIEPILVHYLISLLKIFKSTKIFNQVDSLA